MRSASLCLGVFLVFGIMLSACSAKDTDGDDAGAAPRSGPQAAASSPQAAGSEPNEPLVLSDTERQQAGIRVQAVEPSIVNAPITLTGIVSANQDRLAKVVPRLSGRITSVPVALGAQVLAGQTLAVIESFELGEARLALLQARSEAAVADPALKRAEQLFGEDIIPRKDLLRARADGQRANAALRAAADKLRMLGVSAAVAQGRADPVYPLTAPFAGTVIEKQATVGTLADKEPLFTVADLTTVWVIADVFERDLAKLSVGRKAQVTVAGYPGEVFAGRLAYLSDTVDMTTKTVKAHIELPNPGRRLKLGMFATTSLETASTQQVLAVPSAAVTLMNGQPTVFVESEKGFGPRQVEIGFEQGGDVVVREGLAAGERLAVEGVYVLKSRLLKSQLGTND